VIAADNYLSSSEEISRQLRQRVEHGLIHACLSGQYIPHVLRQRVANFTGLADSMVADGRLQAWERDFIERLEHSEVLEELIQKSGYRTERVERALIKGVRWDQALMLRFDDTASNSIDRWMYWLDHTTGTDSGFVHPTLRERWQRLQIVQPLHWSTLVVFACVMGLFGYALDLIGVPLSSFFDSSTANKVITVVLLAVFVKCC